MSNYYEQLKNQATHLENTTTEDERWVDEVIAAVEEGKNSVIENPNELIEENEVEENEVEENEVEETVHHAPPTPSIPTTPSENLMEGRPSTFEELEYKTEGYGQPEEFAGYQQPKQAVIPSVQTTYAQPTRIATPIPHTGGVKMENSLIFEGDSFLTEGLRESLYSTDADTLSIPLENKELYKIKVNVDSVEEVINNAFVTNPKRISFALEELGLNNRLLEMGNIPRQFPNFTLIRTDKGNVVVHHNQLSYSEIEREFMTEANNCVKEGRRIVIPLLEEYTFTDELGLTLTRRRFRASFAEIKKFVDRTQMKGKINDHAMLLIYE